jgi:hypothetical protein
MKTDTATKLFRDLAEKHPQASKEELLALFTKALDDLPEDAQEDALKEVVSWFWRNHKDRHN